MKAELTNLEKEVIRRKVYSARSARNVKVQCQECGRRFQTCSLIPICPKCGSTDIDLR